MKKNVFKMSAFALMLAWAGCSNEEIATTAQGGDDTLSPGEAIIEISLTNANSRAARPVGSSATANNVDHYKLVILKDGVEDKSVTVTHVDGTAVDSNDPTAENGTTWKNTISTESTGDTNRENGLKKIKLSGLTKGEYTIISYAYNGESDPYASTLSGSTFTTVNKLTGFNVEELFAGSVKVSATEEGKFTTQPKVTMERQVAGMLAYFMNVPAYVNNEKVEKVVVRANREASSFTFPSTTDLNGKWDSGNSGKTDLLTFTMSTATNYADAKVGQIYTFNAAGEEGKKYQLADGMSPNASLKCVDNSLFGGRFVLPYESHEASQTLSIHILGADDKELKALNVTIEKAPSEGNKYQYDIRRNNFYSIGKKLFTDNTEGKDTTTPEAVPGEEDKDAPIDLSKSDELIVTLNDAWGVVHNAGVE